MSRNKIILDTLEENQEFNLKNNIKIALYPNIKAELPAIDIKFGPHSNGKQNYYRMRRTI